VSVARQPLIAKDSGDLRLNELEDRIDALEGAAHGQRCRKQHTELVGGVAEGERLPREKQLDRDEFHRLQSARFKALQPQHELGDEAEYVYFALERGQPSEKPSQRRHVVLRMEDLDESLDDRLLRHCLQA
jgi:hypothetical protein